VKVRLCPVRLLMAPMLTSRWALGVRPRAGSGLDAALGAALGATLEVAGGTSGATTTADAAGNTCCASTGAPSSRPSIRRAAPAMTISAPARRRAQGNSLPQGYSPAQRCRQND
jgi:hypothetical protein